MERTRAKQLNERISSGGRRLAPTGPEPEELTEAELQERTPAIVRGLFGPMQRLIDAAEDLKDLRSKFNRGEGAFEDFARGVSTIDALAKWANTLHNDYYDAYNKIAKSKGQAPVVDVMGHAKKRKSNVRKRR